MSWTAATQISTGLAFLSFIVAAALAAYRAKLRNQLDQLKSLPASERAEASKAILNTFGVDASKLTKEQQFLLAMKELEGQEVRYKYTVFSAIVIILSSIAVAAYSINQAGVETSNGVGTVVKTETKKSDEIWVGCEESKNAFLEYHAPSNATQLNCSAQWINIAALKSKESHCEVVGSTAKATGNIHGLDKVFLNCPGGGHGTLEMSVTYKVPS